METNIRLHHQSASFFYQAEDGIRDGRVTGVQTCALPISRRQPAVRALAGGGSESLPRRAVGGAHPFRRQRDDRFPRRDNPGGAGARSAARARRSAGRVRSEERRVGKGGTVWWWRARVRET